MRKRWIKATTGCTFAVLPFAVLPVAAAATTSVGPGFIVLIVALVAILPLMFIFRSDMGQKWQKHHKTDQAAQTKESTTQPTGEVAGSDQSDVAPDAAPNLEAPEEEAGD